MMAGWNKVELGSICSIKGGKRLPKGHELIEIETDHKYIRARDIKNGKINFDQPTYISESTYSLISRYIVNKGDVIITIVGANIGDTAMVTKEFDGANLTENAVKLVSDKDKADSLFLKYALVPNYMKYYFQTVASGAAQDKLGIYKIKKIKINLPPLKTQRKIASTLSAYDDLIENNLKRIKLLEEQAQLTYEEWFVRFKFPGHETTKFNEETGLPEGWEKVKLVECANLIMGQSPKSEFYNNEEKGLPFHQGVKDYGFRFPTNSSWSTQGNRIAKENSILFSVRAPVGRLNVALEEIIIGRGLAAINHKKGWNSFLLYQLQNIFYEDNLMGGGAIYNSVTKKDVQDIEIISATEDINIKYNDFSSSVDKQIKNLTKQNQHLKEARDILLPRLMIGMIDVEKMEVGKTNLKVDENNDLYSKE